MILQFLGCWFLVVNALGAFLVLSGTAQTSEDNQESEIFKWLVVPGVQVATFYVRRKGE